MVELKKGNITVREAELIGMDLSKMDVPELEGIPLSLGWNNLLALVNGRIVGKEKFTKDSPLFEVMDTFGDLMRDESFLGIPSVKAL